MSDPHISWIAHFIKKALASASAFWQGHKDLNPEPTVLETAALPIELYPYVNIKGEIARIFSGGPSGIRTRDYPVMSRRL